MTAKIAVHIQYCTGTINHVERFGGGAPERRKMSGRYKAIPEKTKNRPLVYVVIDTLTGEWKHVYDCFLWAEHKADEMNEMWSIMNGRDQE